MHAAVHAPSWLSDFLLVYFESDTNKPKVDTNMALTDAKIRALKAKERPYKLSDGEGLYVLVQPNGSRLWRVAYRYMGKQRALALGQYPVMSFLGARQARDDAERLLACGTDPSSARKAEKRSKMIAAGNTFKAVAEEWFGTNKGRWVESYSARLWSRLGSDLLPASVSPKRPIVVGEDRF
jgi:hypothetical protein